jgi:electron transport complex protein RnfB
MNPIFKKLAHHLDRIPNGYPATASGVELKILARLFTPEEAEVACNMSLDSLSVNTIAKRLGQNERDTFIKLKSMVKKGLIKSARMPVSMLNLPACLNNTITKLCTIC